MNRLKVLNRNQLKYIAMLLMLCDHIGLAFFEQGTIVWYVLRYVLGRSAFPIFCVLFIEGIYYTKRPLVHLRDCLIFAFLSEVPFDMVCSGKYFDLHHQNVMFTWFLGLLVCLISRKFLDISIDDSDISETVCGLASFGVCLVFCIVAYVCRVDYISIGIFSMFLIFLVGYRTKFKCSYALLGVVVAFIDGLCSVTIWTFPAVLLLCLYDNKRYVKTAALQKYSFYLFYPVHLFVIGLLAMYVF